MLRPLWEKLGKALMRGLFCILPLTRICNARRSLANSYSLFHKGRGAEIEKGHRMIKNLLTKMFTRKNLDDAIANAAKGGLEKTLGVWDLIILGVGAIIGSGIFAVVGIAAAGSPDGTSPGAGPALIISMVIAAIACVFSALCYTEFATMIPVAGGAYTYTFATLGEFAAWMVGWVLMLEYGMTIS